MAAQAMAEPVSGGEAVWTTPEYLAGWQLRPVDAAGAYALGFTGKGVTVGVVDSGLDTRHPEFSGRVIEGYDFVNGRPISGAGNFDGDGHGTHVSGIIAAGRDGVGMHGAAFDAWLAPVAPNIKSSDPDAIFAASWRLLAERGVPIVNNSIGINECAEEIRPPCNVSDYKPGDFERDLPDTVAAMKYTAEKGVLMVFATGNEAQPAPDALAGMPLLIPELRDNWIAVGAVDADNKLAWFSNRCGVAAQWCLVAPGVEDLSTVPLGTGTSPDKNYMRESGTSMAAPVVSGIAALVKQAFPFFTAKDLQQTLLTTATDMGDPDAFGWGLVNAARAVKGYGLFTSDVVLDTRGFDASFGNDIAGTGSLTKTGPGTLTMTGANTYEGGTKVLGGGLSVEGSLSSRVDVGTGGTLSGSGTIDAPLTVAGVLAPGNASGTLTVSGPVELRTTATTRFSIDGGGMGTGAGDYSRLVAAGPVSVGGTLLPVMRGIAGDATNAFVAPLGARFDVIRAGAGLMGSFSGLRQPDTGGLDKASRFDAVYHRDGVALVVTPLLYGNLAANGLAATANQDAVGGALDAVRPAAGPRASPLLAGLYSTGAGDLASALGRLSGEVHASAAAMAIERSGMMRDAIGERIQGAFAGDAEERATIWSSAYGGWGDAHGGDAALFEWDTANLLFGADAPAGDAARIGIAGGFGRSKGEIGSLGATADAAHIDLLAYAAAMLGVLEASAGVAHSWSDVDTARHHAFGGFQDRLTASYDSDATQAFGELGYRAKAGRFELNPFVSGAYVVLPGDGFSEAGGASALSGRIATRDVGVGVAGLRVSADYSLGSGKLSAAATLGWQHIYGRTTGVADAAFAAGPDFRVQGAGLARDAARIDFSGEYALGARARAGLSYRGAFGDESVSSSIRGDLSLAF